MTMLTQAARALKDLDLASAASGISGSEECERFYRDAAYAVLQAIRTASQEMIDEGAVVVANKDPQFNSLMPYSFANQVWQAMIDTILAERD